MLVKCTPQTGTLATVQYDWEVVGKVRMANWVARMFNYDLICTSERPLWQHHRKRFEGEQSWKQEGHS